MKNKNINIVITIVNISAILYAIYACQEFPFQKSLKIFSYYTNLNQLFVMIVLCWQPIEYIQNKGKYSMKFKQFLQFIMLSSIIISGIFWGGTLLFGSKIFLGRNPMNFLAILFHGGNALLLLIEFLFINNGFTINRVLYDKQPYYALSIYYSIVTTNYYMYQRFPYPPLKHLPFLINCSIFLVIAIIVFAVYPILMIKLSKLFSKKVKEQLIQ